MRWRTFLSAFRIFLLFLSFVSFTTSYRDANVLALLLCRDAWIGTSGLSPCSGTIILSSTNVFTSSCPSSLAQSNEFRIASVARSFVTRFCNDPGETDANTWNRWKAESNAISSSLSRFCRDLLASL